MSLVSESADPLELGETEEISIYVSDISGINQVLIEYDGINHSMAHLENDMWHFNSWQPSDIGNYCFLHVENQTADAS